MSLGNKIKEYRNRAGLTQKELAEKLFVTYQAVSRWENDEVEPSVDTLSKMSDLFSCSVDELLGLNNNQEEINKSYNHNEKVIAVCEQCGKKIYSEGDLCAETTYNTEYVTRRFGKTHRVVPKRVASGQKFYCKKCYEEITAERKQRAENEARVKKEMDHALLKKRRINSFIWPTLALILMTIVGQFLPGIIVFTFLADLILKENCIGDIWMTVTSWGFVRMPGVIFQFSIGGLVTGLLIKLFLWILGIIIAIIAALVATAICLIISPFVYPFALVRNIKGIRKEED